MRQRMTSHNCERDTVAFFLISLVAVDVLLPGAGNLVIHDSCGETRASGAAAPLGVLLAGDPSQSIGSAGARHCSASLRAQKKRPPSLRIADASVPNSGAW